MNKLEFAQLMYGESVATHGSQDISDYCYKKAMYWRELINNMSLKTEAGKFVSDEAVMAYLLGSGRIIDAVIHYRKITHSPLVAAKTIVERMRYELRVFVENHFKG